MDTIIEQMLKFYATDTLYDKKNAMKEVLQELVLCGLSRGGFFKEAAFYGGAALRIFHGLDRFSEDLDFSLLAQNENFDFTSFLPALEKEIMAYGLNMTISEKKKTKDSQIMSAFLKGNTKEHMLKFYADDASASAVAANESIRIKFEVDIDPPPQATYEHKYRLLPVPYEVRLYDMPSLFAGKIHAVLCRGWQKRIKGRDLYDYVFYLSSKTQVNIEHLNQRLLQTGHVAEGEDASLDEIKQMLYKRFDVIDYKLAKRDIEPFIKNTSVLDIWGPEFFKQITGDLAAE